MSFDLSSFDFSSMKAALGSDPFADSENKFKSDDRFYVLHKNENGAGAAVIAFLPDSEKQPILKMNKINTTIIRNGKKRFVSEWSPTTIGLPDPFHEKWQELWNAGDKEGSRTYARTIRYIANIKVIKDPSNPENEGKVFLLDMSRTMKDKITNALEPSPEDISLGAEPKEVLNPLRGWVFNLKAQRSANGMISYDSSEFKKLPEGQSIYGPTDEAHIQETAQKCVADIKEHTYKLSEFLKPEAFKSYDELKQKMAWVNFENPVSSQNTVSVAAPQAPKPEINEAKSVSQPAQTTTTPTEPNPVSDVDDLLKGLI